MPQDLPSSTNESPSLSPQHSPQQVLPQPNPPPTTPSSGSQINLLAKPFIPAAAAPQNVHSSPQQNIPKSTNGEGVIRSRQHGKSKGQDKQLCFCCKQPGHLKRNCPELLYCSKCKTKGHVPTKCPTKQQDAEQAPEGHEFHGPTHKGNELTETSGRDHRINPDSPTQTTDASTVQETTQPMIVQRDTSIRHLPLATLPVV